MASLFGRNALTERARQIATDDILEHVALVQTWLDDYDSGSLKKDKETAREQQYNADFFVKILGYRSKPANPYTFEPKDTTEQRQYPDAVLRYTELGDTPIDNVAAVVELKGASIPLDKPQQREGNLSPVQQAFKYKPQYRVCPFVVVSNFFEFRLYNDNQLDYEVWTLRDLADPTDDYLAFKKWYYLLKADNFVAKTGKSNTEKFLTDIRQEQIEIGQAFYGEYREIRLELLRDIWRNNPLQRKNFQTAIQKAQTIIDRIVFVCFAEDSGLLPDDTLARTLNYAETSPHESVWGAFKSFFKSLNEGSPKLGIPTGYGGALFRDDEDLNALDISDAAIRELVKLGGKYDFEDDLTVTVLGHIFEQSITDLEVIREKVEKGDFATEAKKPSKVGRRKREGVFYTPEYVVRYIVERTVGQYLGEIEEDLKRKQNLTGMRTDAGYEKRERQVYTEYQYHLQNIRVLDPACGSGAFLVGVFDYLLAENQRVDDILGGSLTSTEDYVRMILSDNIFGVDLNEESVEITKLSLWLKTAAKDKPLTSLDANIRVGNSIFKDPALAGAKAFDWESEFPRIFARGGFDVVVGNPPYGVSFTEAEKKYLTAFDALVPDYEIYIYFISLVRALLKPGGFMSYIFPNTFLVNVYGQAYRERLLDEYQVFEMLDLTNDPTFADAAVRTIVMSLANRKGDYETIMNIIDPADKRISTVQAVSKQQMLDSSDNLLALFTRKPQEATLINKIRAKSIPLSEIMDVSQGYIPYRRSDLRKQYGQERGDAIVDGREWHSTEKLDASYKRELAGRELYRYSIKKLPSTSYVKYGKHVASYVDPRFFTGPRILVREITSTHLYAAVTDEELYTNPSVINAVPIESDLDLHALLAIINSRLMGWYHAHTSPKAMKGLFPKILVADVRKLPIVMPEDASVLSELAKKLTLTLSELTDLSDDFKMLIMHELKLASWPRTLGSWWRLPFDSFISGVSKKKIPLAQKGEVLSLFNQYVRKIDPLDCQIEQMDSHIDRIVYDLYGLSQDEVDMLDTNQ